MGVQTVPGAKVNTSGDQPVSVTSPAGLALGLYGGISAYGYQRVATEPTSLFYDSFDTGTGLDTTVKWTAGGTVAPALSTGGLNLQQGTVASASSSLQSKPTFGAQGLAFQTVGWTGRFETINSTPGTAFYTNTHRFMGLGAGPTTTWQAAYTGASNTGPMQNGYGFEIDVDGFMYPVVYDTGVRTRGTIISGAANLNVGRTLADGKVHQFLIVMRAEAVYWYLDGTEVPVATYNYTSANFSQPDIAQLPLRFAAINATTAASGAPLTRVGAVGVGDTGKNSSQLTDGTYPWRKATVGANGGLKVGGAGQPIVSTNFGATGTGTAGPVDVSEMGNVTFVIKNNPAGAAYTGIGPTIVFEQSDDNVSWGPLAVVRSDTNAVASIHTFAPFASNGAVVVEASLEAVNYVRARVTSGTSTGGFTIAIGAGGMPFMQSITTIDRKDAGRQSISLYATGSASGATGVETAQAMAGVRGGVPISSAVSIALTPGRVTRITGIRFRSIGSATATTQSTIHRLRLSTAGAVTTTTTPILFQVRTTTPATALASDWFDVPLGDGYEIVVAPAGSVQIGVTAASTFVTNAPTWDVQITGYEYVA